jgi:hypothetical protein
MVLFLVIVNGVFDGALVGVIGTTERTVRRAHPQRSGVLRGRRPGERGLMGTCQAAAVALARVVVGWKLQVAVPRRLGGTRQWATVQRRLA